MNKCNWVLDNQQPCVLLSEPSDHFPASLCTLIRGSRDAQVCVALVAAHGSWGHVAVSAHVTLKCSTSSPDIAKERWYLFCILASRLIRILKIVGSLLKKIKIKYKKL